MLKSELIERIQKKTRSTCYPALNEDQILAVLNAFCSVCHEAMLEEDRVILSGLGTFGSRRSILHSDSETETDPPESLQILRPYFKFSKNAEKLLKDASADRLNPAACAVYSESSVSDSCGSKKPA